MEQSGPSITGEASGSDSQGREGTSSAARGGGVGGTLASEGGDGPPGGEPPKPLKRGSACLYCRKRKLKCTGTRPCPVCTRQGIECTFDDPNKTAKSRVKQLEEKIAGLEDMLNSSAGSSSLIPSRPHPTPTRQRDRSSSFPYPPTKPSHTPAAATQADQQIEFSLALQELFRPDPNSDHLTAIDFASSTFADGGSSSYLPYSDPRANLTHAQPNPAAPDFFPAYGRFAPLVNIHYPIGQQVQSSPTISPPLDPSFWNLQGGATADTPVFTDPSLDFSGLFVSPPPTAAPDLEPANPLDFGLAGFRFDDPPASLPMPTRSVPAWSPSNTTGAVGGGGVNTVDWGDGTVMPEGMRDHLLKLFFERRRQFCTINHVGRFWASLDGPPEARPAPALLFAMYACAARFSPNPHIQALEDTFFTLGRRNIEIGTTSYTDQRLVQVIQASVVLSIYCYSKSRYIEGWMQGGASIRLANTCRLHRLSAKQIAYNMQCFADGVEIPKDYRSHYVVTICPPKDGIELGERVWTFWGAAFIDQIGSIAVGRTPSLGYAEIETPLPRPLDEFESGSIELSACRSVYDLLSDSPTRAPSGALGGILFEAVMLLSCASSLDDHFLIPSLRDEHVAQASFPPGTTPTTSSISSSASPMDEFPLSSPLESSPNEGVPQTSPGPSVPASLTTRPLPAEWRQTEDALLRFVAQLPQQYRDPSKPQLGGIPPWHSDHGIPSDQGTYDAPSASNTKVGIQPVVFSLHATICTAFTVLYTEAASFDPSYRVKAMQAASSAVQLIQLVADIDFGQLDIFLIVYWRKLARVILDEVQTLRKEGETERAASLLIDVDVLVLAMKRMGQLWSYGIDLADDLFQEDGKLDPTAQRQHGSRPASGI